MGQKVNPIGLRLGISKTWNSKWFAEKDYAEQLKQDLDIQSFIKKRLRHAAISRIEVERTPKKMKVNIYTARPGIIIGRKGDEVERLRNELSGKMKRDEVVVNIREVKRPEIDATLMAENIANQLERRIAYRRAIKLVSKTNPKKGDLPVLTEFANLTQYGFVHRDLMRFTKDGVKHLMKLGKDTIDAAVTVDQSFMPLQKRVESAINQLERAEEEEAYDDD